MVPGNVLDPRVVYEDRKTRMRGLVALMAERRRGRIAYNMDEKQAVLNFIKCIHIAAPARGQRDY